MAQLKKFCEKIILIIITISLLLTFCAMPSSYAKLDLEEGEFYYAGTQKGQYTVSEGIFEWLLSKIGEIADWLLGIITMGFRMVFVGWTALLEKLLTWGLESVAGVSNSGEIIESNTDLTAITDSANNVTIEAIVYNHVPALNANIFELEPGKEELKYSGTGQVLKCSKCTNEDGSKKSVEECCGEDGASCCAECGGNCDGCKAYKEALARYEDPDASEPIITQIKKTVAMWYYILRTLAIAAMLVVLIVVGIKMATSTIASDKAIYKNMLMDWLIGMIILFSMHYIMLFVFYVNEELVSVIEDTAHSITEVQMMQLAHDDSQEGTQYSNSEIELKVYEAVRTRAYDAKLVNGLSGMIMYMTLVYFAFRYTLVYLKRFFTIVVLTIMAPGIGVGYAMQKVLTGKQEAFKNWLSEFVLNVIIQTAHALIYAIFISQALVLSLESIPGIIVALILMNYTLKADALFRKIFRLSTGGLVDDTNNAMEAFKDTAQSVMIGGKAAASTLTNTPYATGVKGIAKAAVAAPFIGGLAIKKGTSAIRNRTNRNTETASSDEEREQTDSSEDTETSEENNNTKKSKKNENGSKNSSDKKAQKLTAGSISGKSDKELLQTGKKTLEKNVEDAKTALEKAKTPEEEKKATTNYEMAKADMARYLALTTPTNLDIAKGHLERLLDVENNFVLNKNLSFGQNLKSLKRGVFGTTYRDNITGKKVNDGNGFYNQFRPTNLFGLTKEDKALLKKQFGIAAGTITGMGSMLLGMGTIVANPKVGMALLASGVHLTNKGLGRPTTINRYKGKYTFSRFGIPAIKNMSDIAIEKARKESDLYMINRLKQNHPKLYSKLKLNAVTAGTLAAAIGTGSLIVPAAMLGAGMSTKKFIRNTNIGQGLEDLNDHYKKQQKEQEKQFKIDTLHVMKAEAQARMEFLMEQENQEVSESEDKYKTDLYDALGYKYDPTTGNLTKKGNTSNEFKIKEEFENALDAKMKNNVVEDEIIEDAIESKALTETDRKYIDKEIDNILVEMSNGKKLDLESKSTINDAMKELSSRLAVAGIIEKNQDAEVVFKAGKDGITKALKKKGEIANAKIEVAQQALDGIKQTDQKLIQDAVATLKEQKKVTDYTQLDTKEIISLFQTNKQMQSTRKIKPLTKEKQKEFSDKISKYLSGMEIAKTVTHDSAYAKKKKAKHEVGNKTKRRKRKLDQIFEMSFDTDFDDPAENLINQVENIKDKGGYITDTKGNVMEITSEESDRVLEVLFLRKELEELNNVATEEIELSKGAYPFTKAKKAKSEAIIDYYNDELLVKKYARDNEAIYKDKNYATNTKKYTKEQIEERKKIEEIEKGLDAKKLKMEKSKRAVSEFGPIVDLNDTRKMFAKYR